MAITVNTNVASLNAQRNMANNTVSLNTALRRLSSGLRINSAADDAAGQAISVGLQAQMRGMNQAVRNANDGLSLMGTAESALNEQTNLLQRIRELAVQASSDTNSGSNRASMDQEAGQLKDELDRIARTTQFNGINLLDGSFQGKEIQVGANQGTTQKIGISIGSTRATDLGTIQTTTSGSTSDYTRDSVMPTGGYHIITPGDFTLTVGGTTYNIGPLVNDGVSPAGGGDADKSSPAVANAFNLIKGQTGVTATASNTYVDTNYHQTAGTINSGDLTVNGVNVGQVIITSSTDNSLIDAINNVKNLTGVTAAWNSSYELVLSTADGRNIEYVSHNSANTCGFTFAGLVAAGTYTLHSANDFTIGGADPTYAGLTAGPATQVSTPTTTTTTDNVSTISLTTKDGAQTALQIVDQALSDLNSRRANVGALTNRLGSAISYLSAASENASAANSRIQDADYAQETASMSRAQILAQAGVAVLSQANQGPQLALSLLR